jgi:membrane protein YqaA with SNARE-associated domain
VISPETGLAGLFAASFLAATLLPMPSEAALYGFLQLHPELAWPAIAVATLGNTAGGMTTYLVGRWIATKKPAKHLETVERYGAPALVLAWLPVIGEALVLAAGWLKVNWIAAMAFQAVGRFVRYVVVAGAAGG